VGTNRSSRTSLWNKSYDWI